MNADRADQLLSEILNEGAVIVAVSNTYACGRKSGSTERVPLSIDGGVDETFWNAVNDLTGDGHPCGSREHAYYEATIIEAPGRPELVGETCSWEG